MRRTLLMESLMGLRLDYEKRAQTGKDLHRRARDLSAAGDLEAGQTCYEELLELDSGNAEAWAELGLIYGRSGRFDAAIEAILKGLSLQPATARIHHAFGTMFHMLADPHNALKNYQVAIGVPATSEDLHLIDHHFGGESRDPTALLMRGNLMVAQHRVREAVEIFRLAFERQKSSVAARNLSFAHHILHDPGRERMYAGYALFIDDQFDEALLQLESIPAGADKDLYFYEILITSFLRTRNYEQAVRAYKEATLLHLDTDRIAELICARLHLNGRAAELIQFASDAMEQWPDNITLKFFFHLALPAVYRNEREIELWRERFSDGLRILAETPLETPSDRTKAVNAIASLTNFYLPYQNKNDVDLQRQYGALVHRVMASSFPDRVKQPEIERDGVRIRVGYISAFMTNHSVGNMYLGWLRCRDRTRFEVFCYHLGNKEDLITSEYRRDADHYHHIADDLHATSKQVLTDKLHILVFLDIGMSAIATQLAALRLAPVQCCSWGHSVTSGLPTIGYFISGDAMEPEDAAVHYSEKLVRLPGFGLAFERIDVPAKPKPREEFGIAPDAVVYVCSQSLFKYLPRHDHVFSEIARGVANCKFIFIEESDVAMVRTFRERLRLAFAAAGLDYASYCLLLPRQSWIDYLSVYVCADVYLDSIGWSGCNTSLEAISCGLPIVTVPGEFMRGRHTFAFLKLMEVAETIAETKKDYVSIAIRLGLDSDFRERMRDKISNGQSRLFNSEASVRALEDFYLAATGYSTGGTYRLAK